MLLINVDRSEEPRSVTGYTCGECHVLEPWRPHNFGEPHAAVKARVFLRSAQAAHLPVEVYDVKIHGDEMLKRLSPLALATLAKAGDPVAIGHLDFEERKSKLRPLEKTICKADLPQLYAWLNALGVNPTTPEGRGLRRPEMVRVLLVAFGYEPDAARTHEDDAQGDDEPPEQ